jgi:SpoVK/Ycf46/Vps4 family AAA+-type ATPase
LAAKWLARELSLPLLVLDLAAVMSSFLGRTGNNIRVVLDFARAQPSVLLLDEFDALAKRRDDAGEIGELKRLVTVLLQEIDDWPASGLLIAATNHSDLLDRAIWRRFDRVVQFPMPTQAAIRSLLVDQVGELSKSALDSVTAVLQGHSFADVVRLATNAKRESIVQQVPVSQVLVLSAVRLGERRSTREKLDFALGLVESGLSQREAARLSGVARATLRKSIGVGGRNGA